MNHEMQLFTTRLNKYVQNNSLPSLRVTLVALFHADKEREMRHTAAVVVIATTNNNILTKC